MYFILNYLSFSVPAPSGSPSAPAAAGGSRGGLRLAIVCIPVLTSAILKPLRESGASHLVRG